MFRDVHLVLAFLLFFIVVLTRVPLVKRGNYFRICLSFDPGLEVSDYVLVVEAAEVGDLPSDELVLIGVHLVREFYLLDGVHIAVKLVSRLVNDTEGSSADLLELLEVILVPR